MRSIIIFVVLVTMTVTWCLRSSYASSASPNTPVEPYVYVIGGVHNPGRYDWFNGMTVLNAIGAAGGFTNFITGRISIFHVDGTKDSYKYLGVVDDIDKSPLPRKGDTVSVPKRIL